MINKAYQSRQIQPEADCELTKQSIPRTANIIAKGQAASRGMIIIVSPK